jgi:DNA helicase HerA-like ATPase
MSSSESNDKSAFTGLQPKTAGSKLVKSSSGTAATSPQQASSDATRNAAISFELGVLRNDPSVQIAATPEQLFGRHCGIIGATGGGKSWTVAKLVEECAKHRSKVIIFDATGEYHTLTHGVRHLYIGNDPEPTKGSMAVSVPYFHLRESDLATIFKPSGPSQAPKLRAAMRSLKLARLAPHLAVDGTIMKAHRNKVEFEEQSAIFNSDLDSPYALLEISNLVRQIQHECVDPFRSAVEPLIWGGVNAIELSNCNSLVSRIADIITLPQLACIFNCGDLPSVFDEIHTFLKDPVSRVLRLSLKYLPFDYSAREIVVNALARHLLELAREEVFRHLPLVVFIDEAHQFLNTDFEEELSKGASINAMSLIAKEGRKYALTLALATQRPRDIPENVLSQMGTLMVHRLINHYDLDVVEKAAGSMSRELMNTVPTLKSGECLLVGVDFDQPRLIKVKAPECPPSSRSADYQKLWK